MNEPEDPGGGDPSGDLGAVIMSFLILVASMVVTVVVYYVLVNLSWSVGPTSGPELSRAIVVTISWESSTTGTTTLSGSTSPYCSWCWPWFWHWRRGCWSVDHARLTRQRGADKEAGAATPVTAPAPTQRLPTRRGNDWREWRQITDR